MAHIKPVAVRHNLPVAILLAFSLVLCGCGENSSQAGPGGLTPEDARALDDAAEKLDGKALPPPTPEQMAPLPVTPPSVTPPQKASAATASEKSASVQK